MFLRNHDRLQVAVPGRRFALEQQPGERPLLPQEPRIANAAFEQQLTEQHLLPALPALEAFFLALRLSLDPLLLAANPHKLGKAYPYGQCLEITLAMGRLLKRAATLQLQGSARAGQRAFLAFIRAGGSLRLAWGDLRGEFFQNALLLGTLYVDVSNDTVVLTKPKVEILPFTEANFRPIEDFRHFVRIGERYWHSQFYPNHALPELAPFCPLLRVTADQHIQLCEPSTYMLALTLSRQFRPSEDMLRAPLLPQALFAQLTDLLQAGNSWQHGKPKLAASPEEGRRRALELCRSYRTRHWSALRPQQHPLMQSIISTSRWLAQQQSGTAAAHAPVQHQTAEGATRGAARHIALSRSMHRQHHWVAPRHFSFAAGDALVPLNLRELPAAALALPTAFMQQPDGLMLVGVQGLLPGRNLMVDAQGNWRGTHLPEAYRCHPFALALQDQQHLLCIETASCVATPQPDSAALFDASGALSDKVQQVFTFLGQREQQYRRTRALCLQLQQHGLLQPWPPEPAAAAPGAQAAAVGMKGLLCVDAAALEQLPDAAFLELRRSGALQLAWCHLQSLQHLPALRRLARSAAGAS